MGQATGDAGGGAQGDAEAMGLEAGDAQRAARLVRIMRRGDRLPSGGELVLEDGSELGAVRTIPREVPYGYHRHRAAPRSSCCWSRRHAARCRGWRTWGWAVQLYAARSRTSWGMGDLADLRRLAAWSAELRRARCWSARWAPPTRRRIEPSPTTRARVASGTRFTWRSRSPATASWPELAPLARAGRALNGSSAIVRSEVRRLCWLRSSDSGGHARGRLRPAPAGRRAAAARPDLQRWGLYAALSEEHGPGWGHGRTSCAIRRASRCGARLGAYRAHRLSCPGCSGCWTARWRRPVASCV